MTIFLSYLSSKQKEITHVTYQLIMDRHYRSQH